MIATLRSAPAAGAGATIDRAGDLSDADAASFHTSAPVRRETSIEPQGVGLSAVNARRLVTRARRRLCGERRSPVRRGEQQRLLDALLAAVHTGDVAILERLLAADVSSCAGCGGQGTTITEG
jgi:hypothetical protein